MKFFFPRTGLLFLFALMLMPGPLSAEEGPTGRVAGKIVCGAADCVGVASLWDAGGPPPDPRRYVVIPVSVTTLRPDGAFEIQAPPGRYYVGAVLRRNRAGRVGPPGPGDRIFMSPDAAGEFKIVEVLAGKTVNVGSPGEGWVYQGFTPGDGPSVAGRVLDLAGEPVPNLLVFAFLDPGMSERPLAVSERTNAAGDFHLRLPGPGSVYLRVMENYGGGRPAEGGYMGVYGGAEPRSLSIPENRAVRDVVIEVFRIPSMKNREQMRLKPSGR